VIRSLGMALDEDVRSTNPKPASYGERLATTLASHIIATYAKPVHREMPNLGPHWTKLRRCIDLMHARLDEQLSLDQLALEAGMSKFHFAKSFREVIGIPPHQYLVKLRIEKARALLRDDRISVAEIGYRVGYTDIGQFSAQFRKAIGFSPAQYRRQTMKSE
jgi:AraC family transcriptional regulator